MEKLGKDERVRQKLMETLLVRNQKKAIVKELTFSSF